MAEFDLVIRGGTVVDGNGGAPRVADVAVRDGKIAEVGAVSSRGDREIDAAGLIIGPGFVDIHTHYDGQAVWDDRLEPSSGHGVTTAVAGNCGVGFAPVKPEHREKLIALMEGVEDIPGTALHTGLSWSWTTFGEYLDILEARAWDIDLATQVPHAALRFWAMGDRAAALEAATEEEIAEMAELAAQAIRDGALGFSTSRTINHKSRSGEVTPTYGTEAAELNGIAAAVGATGTGVLQFVTDYPDLTEDFALMRGMVVASGGRPLSVSLLQKRNLPRLYQPTLDEITAANEAGIPIRAQVASRGVGVLMGLQCTVHPFIMNPVFQTIRHLPVSELAARMTDPEMRAAILAAQTDQLAENLPGGLRINQYEAMWELGEYPDYEPDISDTVLSRATREGRAPEELVYDILIKDEGRGMIQQPFTNYFDGNLEAVREMLTHPYTLPGLGDGGAHVGAICDSSFTGNGSTGVQLLSEVAKSARQVYVHVRTPQWIAARERYRERLSPESRWLLDTLPYYPNWYTYSLLAMQEGSQKLHTIDPDWVAQSGKVNEVNDKFREALESYIAKQLEGHPDLIEKLTPKHPPMARRQVADNNWYKTLLEPHVDLVLGTIDHVTADGIVSGDGTERHVDDIITATGFAITKYLHPAKYTGKGGQTLNEFWDSDPEGPKAYLGMTVPGFPNLFTLYGPNAQPRSGAIVGWFETWTQYIARAIVYLTERGYREIDVKPEVFEQYNQDLVKESEDKVWLHPDAVERNYYVNDAGRLQVGVPWNLEDYFDFFQRTEFSEDYQLS